MIRYFMINIYLHTTGFLKISFINIFDSYEGFSVTDLENCHIVISDNLHYKTERPILYLGTDICTPTKVSILLKTITAIVNRVQVSAPLSKGKITLYPENETLIIGDATYALTDKEVKIMAKMLTKDTITRQDLLQSVWQYDPDVNTHTIQTHIYRLKKKCGTNLVIATSEGVYTLNPEVL